MNLFLSLKNWVKKLFSNGQDGGSDDYSLKTSNLYFRELAFWSCVNLVSSALNKCEFQTYIKGKPVKLREYYRWNIEPNTEQNASQFYNKLVAYLYRTNEVLIITKDKMLYVADSFHKEFLPDGSLVFLDVEINKQKQEGLYTSHDVIYLEMSHEPLNSLIKKIDATYQNLISTGIESYQGSRKRKAIYRHGSLPIEGTPEREAHDKLTKEKFASIFSNANSVIPLGNGENIEAFEKESGYSKETTRDLRSMVDDICDFTAKVFLIPPSLIRGDVQDTKEAMNQFISLCIQPLVLMIEKEINRKLNGYQGFQDGNCFSIDTTQIKYVDLLQMATAIDKLISSGAFCINDIRKLTGQTVIEEAWAYQHFMTKNYSSVEEIMQTLEGGVHT